MSVINVPSDFLTEGMMSRAKRIRECRKKAGLTQKDLGERLGLSATAIMRYEKGQREPRLDILASISKCLKVPLTYLMGYDDDLSSSFDGGQILDDIMSLELSGQYSEAAKLKTHYNVKDYPTVIDDKTGLVIPESELKRRDAILEDLIDLVETDREAFRLLDNFNLLNDVGREVAADRVEELTEIKKYQKEK